MAAWSVWTRPSSWLTSAVWASTCCGGNRVLLGQGLVAGEVDLGLLQLGLRLEELALGLLERDLVGPGVDRSPGNRPCDHLALLEGDCDEDCPLIWVCTVTVASGVTVPSPSR